MRIRLLGLGLLALCGLGFFALTQFAAVPGAARSTGLELALAGFCVLAGMAGLPLLVAGRKLFAPAPVPMRSRHNVSGYIEAL